MIAPLERQLEQIERTLERQLDMARMGQIDQACQLMPQLQQQLSAINMDLSADGHADADGMALEVLRARTARIRHLHSQLSMAVAVEKQHALGQLAQLAQGRQISQAYACDKTHNLCNQLDLT